MKKILKTLKAKVFIGLVICLSCVQAAEDNHYYSIFTEKKIAIDGLIEAEWDNAIWDGMNYVWLNDDVPDSTDYYGRYKMMWDSNYLYLLVEVTDDSLSDKNIDPLVNYYNDECVEIFLDPNKDGGDHQNNFGAWAYHVSTLLDVVDYGTDNAPHLYNDHISAALSKNGDKYIWEMAIKVFDASYDSTKVNVPMTLVNNSLMGFSLAYCDNDGGRNRENFMGSVNTEGHINNEGYLNADVFGSLSLVKELPLPISTSATNLINVETSPKEFRVLLNTENHVKVYDLNGEMVYSKTTFGKDPLGSELNQGIYFIRLNNESQSIKWNKTK